MRLVRFSVILLVVCSATAAAAPVMASVHSPGPSAQSADGTPATDGANPCVGTVTRRPSVDTFVSIQGARITPERYRKKPALLTAFGPNGSFEFARNASAHGRWWAYDVDRTDDGGLLFATTQSSHSVVGELDPETGEYVWLERFDGAPNSTTDPLVEDAHDVDALGDGELVVADKGQGHERLLVYDRDRDEVVWQWRFADHPDLYPRSGGGPPHDWTHVNDVDQVGEDWFMASVRNFDQVVFVNRTSGDVEMTLGSDGDHDVLYEQHNPDYLRGPGGEHTVLVADSLNDRVVEYARNESTGGWDRVWTATGFDEPRDADRLENGNTLVTDRMGHRVAEITPQGEVVWEVYTPYEPYDAERGAPGSQGPTMREQGVTGTYDATGGENFTTDDVEACAASLFDFAATDAGGFSWSLGGENGATAASEGDGTAGPGLPDWSVLVVLLAALVGLVAAAVGYRRRT